MDCAIAASVNGDALVAYFPAVAVGAMKDALGPHLGDAVEIGELVAHAMREQQPRREGSCAVSKPELKTGTIGVSEPGGNRSQLDTAVGRELLTPDRAQLDRWSAILREEAVYAVRYGVGRRVGVEHKHVATHAAEHERRAETRGPCADAGAIEDLFLWCAVGLG